MRITSKQKKTILPIVVFAASSALFVWGLGSIFVLFCVPFMAVSLGIMVANIVPAIARWLERDGWR